MTEFSRFALSNANNIVLFADVRKSTFQISFSAEHSQLFNMAELGQPLDVNTLQNVHDIEELIQFIVGSNADIANYHSTEDLT